MHMLFLGHGKSNIVMRSKWMSENELLAKWGRQVNLVLRKVAPLRLQRFAAHPLSTSSWGTGPWVSENYVFEMRCTKYLMTMPAINQCRKRRKEPYETELRIVLRFVSASIACIGAIMGGTEVTSDRIRSLVPIYLDCMVEMDDLLTKHKMNTGKRNQSAASNKDCEQWEETHNVNGEEQLSTGDVSDFSDHGSGPKGTLGKKKKKKGFGKGGGKYSPNFVKSNSLGMLAVAEAHDFLGPVPLNWEGGHSGERKIQTVKPELGIKRSNVAWQSIVLDRLYQREGIAWLLERFEQPGEATASRSITNLYRVFKNDSMMNTAVAETQPLAVIVYKSQHFLLYRPHATKAKGVTRSSIWLAPLDFVDQEGKEVCGCWFAPICYSREQTHLTGIESLEELHNHVKLRCLLLPLVGGDTNDSFTNMYYSITDNWTERNKTGEYTSYSLNIQLFKDWRMEGAGNVHET
jgi:hypothetical protein